MYQVTPVGHTGPVTTPPFAARVRAALAPLLRPAPPAPDGPQRLSRWAWVADVVLAVFLAATTVYATAHGAGGDVPIDDPARGGPFGPQGPPGPPPPPVPPVPRPGSVKYPYLVAPDHGTLTSAPLWLLALAALTALPLALRRRYPVAAYASVMAATLVFHAAEQHTWRLHEADTPTVFTFVACLIAAYSAALYSPYRRLAMVALLVGGVLMGTFHDLNVPDIAPGFVPFAVLVPVGLAANTVHTWRQRLRSMEAEKEAATRLAVDMERARIARELHDVVTHNVSMMTVQAGAARTVLATEPELAREALLAVESAGRAAMAELRHVMGLLAMTSDPADAESAELAPQPGLGQVGVLAERVRGTGIPVELAVTGAPVPLPAGVDLAAYRVAQEALTNTVKHASGASVTISVDYLPGEVRIEVADTGGTPSPTAGSGNGRGLMGLRERLAVYGGTLDAGRRITGGYRVRAVIPVGDA
ncbi:Signal transduction histidine kinase [Actinacidiphila cocklensis]|uniref:histidine kinase n=1 Tax=Actinacidiphila cocklensis TaxID=887465 RepID=A0A9W4DXG8_9ACTN|nr:Signal transduction histidine kinase [Actinacidiphila cocklensis]